MESNFSDLQKSRINSLMRELRLADKQVENWNKPPLSSPDMRQTNDFVFSKLDDMRKGDSGDLLLAKRKTDRSERYLVKHAYTDCAANEFVYAKLCHAMDIKTPEVILLQISPNEKRKYFKTEYVMGARFLDVKTSHPSYDIIRTEAVNWKDYFRFCALEHMFAETDSIEILLANDGYIYRVDTTDAFIISTFILDTAGLNVTDNDGNNYKSITQKTIQDKTFDHIWSFQNFDNVLDWLIKTKDSQCTPWFLEPFARIQEIEEVYIDSFLNTLCYFYPDFIGEYYKRFIIALQSKAKEYLKTKGL